MSENFPEYENSDTAKTDQTGYTEQDLVDAAVDSGPDIFVSFGGVVADVRKRMGLDQAGFADAVGISRGQLAMIENNNYPKLTLNTLDDLAFEMGIDRIKLVRLWYQTVYSLK